MTRDTLTYDDVLRIVELIKSSEQFSEFRLKIGEIEIELRRQHAPGFAPAAAPPRPPSSAPLPEQSASAEAPTTIAPLASDVAAAATSARSPASSWPPNAVVVRAPMVGTFYRAPEPGAPPFVEVGQSVEPDTIVCIIEVMKLMNSIPAGARGVVTQVLVENGAPVDTDAPLVVLEPAPSR